MSKGNIIIIECVSSSVNYIKDIYDEGYEPVLLETYRGVTSRIGSRHYHDHELDEMLDDHIIRPRIIRAKKKYEDTLKQIMKLEPVAIIPGMDEGIELATRLAHDLKLQSNNPKNLPKMRNKFLSQQALRDAGIRSIESKIVESYDEALCFYEKMKRKGKAVVIKPISGISSLGVFICRSEKEIKSAFDSYRKNKRLREYIKTKKVLIQECIEGDEYVVNSVSCCGIHKISMILKCKKQIIPKKGKKYDYLISLNEDEDKNIFTPLCNYQFQVLKALEISYGTVHSEIMIDEEGPVLIEANCRLCGLKLKSSILQEVYGISESQLSLKSYLCMDLFNDIKKPTLMEENKKVLLCKSLTILNPCYIKKNSVEEALKNIPGFRYVTSDKKKGFFRETVDLDTELANAKFACQDYHEAIKVSELLREMEQNHPEELYEVIDHLAINWFVNKL